MAAMTPSVTSRSRSGRETRSLRPPGRDDLAKKLVGFFQIPVDLEQRCRKLLSSPPHGRRSIEVVEHRRNRTRERVGVAWWNKTPCLAVANDFGNPSDVGRDDGASCGQGFDDGDWHAFEIQDRRKDDDVQAGEHLRNVAAPPQKS